MRKEFFGNNLEDALNKASQRLGITVQDIKFKVLEGKFSRPFQNEKVVIVVDFDDNQETSKGYKQSQEEILARKKGDDDWARYFINEIFSRMGIQAETTVEKEVDQVVLKVKILNEEINLRRGGFRELRGAIQNLVNRTLSQKGENIKNYIVDLGGNLEARKKEIKNLAEQLIKSVVSKEKTVHIHLMDSLDRRIMHWALSENMGVETKGTGDKQFRILSVMPKK